MKFLDDFGGCLAVLLFSFFLMAFNPGLFLALLGFALVFTFVAQIIGFFTE